MKRVLPLVFVAALAACSSSERSILITDENKDSVLEEIKDSRAFTAEEVRLLMARQVRVAAASALGRSAPEWVGQTLDQAIESERQFQENEKVRQAEAERLAAEAKAEADARAEEMRQAITLTVFDKDFLGSNYRIGRYQDAIIVRCAYENTSGKDIRAFRGAVEFTDLFGEQIMSVNLTIQNPIAAGAKSTWEGSIDYNEFIDTHSKLRNTALSDMKVIWRPSGIIFADGTELGAS